MLARSLTHDHDLERGFRYLKVHAAIVIHPDSGRNIELGKRNSLCGLLPEYPNHSAGDRVIPHLFNMLVAENQRRLRFFINLRLISRFQVRLQSVNLSAQSLHIALHTVVVRIGSPIRGRPIRCIRIRISVFVFSVRVKRIVVPRVRIVCRVRIVRVIGESAREAAMMMKAVSGAKVNTGAVPKAAGTVTEPRALHRTGRMYTRLVSRQSATRGEMGSSASAAVSLRPQGQCKQTQAKRRYGQPAPHVRIIPVCGVLAGSGAIAVGSLWSGGRLARPAVHRRARKSSCLAA